MEDIGQIVKQYIVPEFLPEEDPANLTDSVQLLRDGILDGLATLKLVAFLQERFGIEIEAHEADRSNLDSVADIAELVQRRLHK